MNPRPVLALVPLLMLFCCHAASAGERPAVPLFPDPPQQEAPWQRPETALPASVLRAVEHIFADGLPDPRGCEYRRIRVHAPGHRQPLETSGWLLPVDAQRQGRHAITWTGQIHSVLAMGELADPAADVAALLQRMRQGQQAQPWVTGNVTSEAFGLRHELPTGLEVMFLLRTGHVAAAEAFFSMQEGHFVASGLDPYFEAAWRWAWFTFQRALAAHMIGEDRLAMELAQQLAGHAERIEATAARLGVERRNRPDEGSALWFLQQLPLLVEDTSRRVGSRPPRPLEQVQQIADRQERIDALVDLLEEINERQLGQPGSVHLAQSPIVQALVGEGDAAVEALLVCLEHDPRLTRSVEYGRSFHPQREIIPVYRAAFVALQGIFRTHRFGTATTHGIPPHLRAEAAQEVRAFWQRAQGRSVAQRWYDTLADDDAHHWQWRDAAEQIVRYQRGRPGAMQGEELRAQADPGVSQLLARRIEQTAGALPPRSSDDVFRTGDAARMALMLARWDPSAARPVLQAQIIHCQRMLAAWQHGSAEHLEARIAEMRAVLTAMAASPDEVGPPSP